MRLAQERIALGAQSIEIDATQQLERGVVAVGEADVLGDIALTLKPLAAHWRELGLHQLRACLLDEVPFTHVGRVRQLDRDTLVLQLASVGETNDGARLPRDVALVERCQLARALRFDQPVGEQS